MTSRQEWRDGLRAQAEFQDRVRVTPLREPFFRLVAEFYRGRLSPAMTVLDLGSGRRRLTAGLPGRHVSVDPLVAELKAAGGGWRLAGIGEALPLKNNSIEAALLNSVIHCVIDFPALARELNRALKPGGKVLIQEALGQPVSPSHLRTVELEAVRRALTENGMVVEQVTTRGCRRLNALLVRIDNRLGCGVCSRLLWPLFRLAWRRPGGDWLTFIEARKRA